MNEQWRTSKDHQNKFRAKMRARALIRKGYTEKQATTRAQKEFGLYEPIMLK